MDLTSFTSKKKDKNKIIVDNDDITIKEENGEVSIKVKTKKGLYEYQNSLFCAPTHTLRTREEISEAEEDTQKFFEKAIFEGVEGIMVKGITAPYVSGLRTGSMAKLKETKEDLDVVITAAEHGKGKRAGYFSSFYVSVLSRDSLDSDSDSLLTVGKVSSGIKELGEEGATMINLTKLLKPHTIKEEKDITYFEPKIIIQVRYQEIQPSTTYNSGYALRFPRIIMLREDKPLEEINSIDDIEALK